MNKSETVRDNVEKVVNNVGRCQKIQVVNAEKCVTLSLNILKYKW